MIRRQSGKVVLVFCYNNSKPVNKKMMDKMEKHMKEHMGGGMMGGPMENMQKEPGKGFTQEAEAGGVTVTVTYENPGQDMPEFGIKLDTHSVELDVYSLDKITTLRTDTGDEFTAEVVSASGSDHHREVVLGFKDADLSSASFVELAIRDLAGVEERIFRFELTPGMMRQ